MRQFARTGLAALLLTLVPVAIAAAQAPPAGKAKTATPIPTPNPTAAQVPPAAGTRPAASPNEVVATVNGQDIERGEVVDFLGKYQLPSNLSEEQVYRTAVDSLINTRLLTQFLDKQKVQVDPKKIDENVEIIKKELLETQNKSLAAAMAETGTSIDDLRERIAHRLQWQTFVMARATDAELKKFADANKDALGGAQVRASHILIKVEPDASAAEKDQARAELAKLKQEIAAGKLTFADAANAHSEDDLNVQTKSGGDLNYFPRKGFFIDSFSEAAFKLKPGEVSEPVPTEYGYHLIQVTDRKEGTPPDLAQARNAIVDLYAADLQERIIKAERQSAKIDVKPMPADLFEPPPGELPQALPANPPAPATGSPAPKAAAPKAAAPKAAAPKAANPR